MKRIIALLFISVFISANLTGCGPKQGTVEDKSAVKGDTLDVTEGEGEGPVGEGDHK
ncbi:MAG: hypothetical protein R3345_03440 [Fulvivirga sp.]|nr:hypothetical protein [Fulvivirga sp.]